MIANALAKSTEHPSMLPVHLQDSSISKGLDLGGPG